MSLIQMLYMYTSLIPTYITMHAVKNLQAWVLGIRIHYITYHKIQVSVYRYVYITYAHLCPLTKHTCTACFIHTCIQLSCTNFLPRVTKYSLYYIPLHVQCPACFSIISYTYYNNIIFVSLLLYQCTLVQCTISSDHITN